MIDGEAGGATGPSQRLNYLKTHRTATGLRVRKEGGRLIGRTKGGMTTKLHAVTDSVGRPIRLFVSAGEVNDRIGGRCVGPCLWSNG